MALPEETHINLPNNRPPGPYPVVRDARGTGYAASSFGTYPPNPFGLSEGSDRIDPSSLYDSPRAYELAFRESYFKGTQHDQKASDWDGRVIANNSNGGGSIRTTAPFLGSAGALTHQYIPLSSRRPSTPYRLAKKVVKAFTALLFGEGRWPQLNSDDEDTQAFAQALVEESGLALTMIQARNFGGSCGSVGLSWAFVDGKPRVSVHKSRTVHPIAWRDRDMFIPSHVVELYQFEQLAPDEHGNLVPQAFWYRRDWTEQADVVFIPQPVERAEDEGEWIWQVDEEATTVHGSGECHFVWIVNQPPEEKGEYDGLPDYDGVYEQCDSIDTLNSVLMSGTIRNLDPTLVVKINPQDGVQPPGQKGSGAGINVGANGDAKYLELAGTAASAGQGVLTLERGQVLETCECVLLDPDKAAAAGTSSIALKVIYAPMLGPAEILRMQYGTRGIERIINQMLDAARALTEPQTVSVPVFDENDEPILDEEGNQLEDEEEAVVELLLEPRTIREQTIDADGNPVEVTRQVPQTPGSGRVKLKWGEFFEPTADDRQKETTTIQTAAGSKPVLSQRTAVELVAKTYDRDAGSEWKAVAEEEKARRTAEVEAASGMFPGAGGSTEPDATPPAGEEQGSSNVLTPGDTKIIVKVNEARALLNFGPLLLPDGTPDPDGLLTVAAYEAKMEAKQTAIGESEGEGESGITGDGSQSEDAANGVEPITD